MKIKDFDWQFLQPEVDDASIREIELELGVKLPGDYVEVAKKYHGTYNPGGMFDYLNSEGNKETRSVSVFYSLGDLSKDEYGEHVLLINRMPRTMPDGLVAFAGDANGNHICFDYRHDKDNPSVVFWLATGMDLEETFFLANSFTEFIEKTYMDEED